MYERIGFTFYCKVVGDNYLVVNLLYDYILCQKTNYDYKLLELPVMLHADWFVDIRVILLLTST